MSEPAFKPGSRDVYGWLSHMTTVRPLMEQWLTNGGGNHVAELYKNTKGSETPSLWVWVVCAMSIALICMGIVILIGLGKCCKWEPSHGQNYNLWKLSKNSIRFIWKKIRRKNKYRETDYVNPYEKPVTMELDEIVVYQEGRRVTLESEEKAKLLRDTSLKQTDLIPNSPFSSHNHSTRMNSKFSIKKHTSQTPDQCTSPSLKSRLKCVTKTVSIGPIEELQTAEDFQTRPLPPLPTSPEFILQEDSPFKIHSLFNRSFDEHRKVQLGETKAKLNFEQLEKRLKSNSTQDLYLLDYTAQRKNTLSEFRKHKSTYKSRTKEVSALEIIQYRSNSIDERLSECSLKRQRKHIRRSRSMDDLDNFTINELYVDIKCLYEKLPDNHEETGKQPYDSNRSDFSFNEMTSPRDGGINISMSSIYTATRGENAYTKIIELTEEMSNIQKRPMPPVPTLLDMCFLNKNPASKNHINQPQTSDSVQGRSRRHLSNQFPSFRSSVSGASGHYAKIPDVMGCKRASNLYIHDVIN